MHGDLTSRNMNNGKGSNKGNPKLIDLKVNSRDNLKSRNPKVNHQDNLRFRNHNTLSLKGNLKEGRENTKTRMAKSLTKLPSIISVGQNKKTINVDTQDYFGMKSSKC